MKLRYTLKAGKMINESNRLRPDLRKGQIKILVDESENSHFQWVDSDDHVEDDFFVFPGEFKFTKVVQSKSRVYLLEFEEDRYFYWLQEPDASLDAERCQALNDILGSPKKPEEKKFDTANLAKVLESFAKAQQIPDLDEILTPEVLKGVVEDLKKYPDLIELLPEEQRNTEFLRENLISAQLQQAMQVLSGAIRSPGGPAIFSSLGLQGFDNSGYNIDPLERLLKAIQAKSDSRNNRK